MNDQTPGPMQPSQSTALGGLSGALAFVVIYTLGLLKVPVTPEFASAVTVLVTAGVAYFASGGRAAHIQGNS